MIAIHHFSNATSMELINQQIKELYGSKALFAKHLGIDPKNLSKKIKPIENKINEVTEFLYMLELEIQIAPKGKSAEAKEK